MDKTEALNRLTALESEASELRKIIEAPEPAGSLLTKPVPGSGQDYFSLARDNDTCATLRVLACTSHKLDYPGGNLFQTKELAQAYAEAIDTMLLLRHQPGTVPICDDMSMMYVIRLKRTHADPYTLDIDTWNSSAFMSSFISPCFTTQERAKAAIKTVGAERILRMFKTFHHVEG